MNQSRITMWIAGGLFGGIAGYVFLSRWWFALLSALIGGWLVVRWYAKWIIAERERKEKQAFRIFLENFSARMDANANLRHALQLAAHPLEQEADGDEEGFRLQLRRMLEEEASGRSLREAMIQAARETDVTLIASFWESLLVGMQQGANLARLSQTYLEVVTEEEALRADRRARLDAAKREQALLFVMPLLLLAAMHYFGLVTGEYTFLDYVVRLICLLLFFLAWKWSEQILRDSGLTEKVSGR